MTKRVLSTLPQIPNVIKSQLEGKSDGIREMVTTVLGDGLLSKLVVGPIKALDITGNINSNNSKNPQNVKSEDLDPSKIIAPNTLDPVDRKNLKPEKPKNVETRRNKANLAELLGSGEEQLFVDGRPVKSEENVLKAYEVNRNPNEPEKLLSNFRDNDRTKQLPSETAEIISSLRKNASAKTPPNRLPGFSPISTPAPQAIAETLLSALKQFFGNDDAAKSTTTANPQESVQQIAASEATPLPNGVGMNSVVSALPMVNAFGYKPGSIDFTKIDPSRLNEIYSLMKVTPRPEYPGSESSIRRSNLKNSIDALLLSLRSRDLSELSIEEVKSLQGYLQSYEQSLQTKELLQARQKLQMIQTELDEQKLKIQEQKFQEEQLQMQAARLEEQRRRMEEQLQRQLYTWHGAFKTLNPQEVPSIPSFPDSVNGGFIKTPVNFPSIPDSTKDNAIGPYEILETTTLKRNHDREYEIRKAPAKDPSFLDGKKLLFENFDEESLKKLSDKNSVSALNARATSGLERQLRYAPDNKQTPAASRTFSMNYTTTTMSCTCEDIDITKIRGTWIQTLSSDALLKSMYKAVGSIFDEHNEVELSCSDLKISGPSGIYRNYSVPYVWTFKTANSDRIFRISGNISKNPNSLAFISGENFSGQEFYFPICVLKAGQDDSGDYEYITVAKADDDGCSSATLLVKNPENFFNAPDTLLLKYLRKKIAVKEIDEMDVVPHGKSCTP